MTREHAPPSAMEDSHESIEDSISHILVHISSYVIIAGVFGALAWLYRKPIQPPCQPVGSIYGCLHSNSLVHWLCHGSSSSPSSSPLLPTHTLASNTNGGNGNGNGNGNGAPNASNGAAAKKAEAKADANTLSDGLNLIFCFLGLQVSYVSWGYFQERIMTQDYGSGDRFDNSEFLVFLNRIAAVILAVVLNWVRGAPTDTAPPYVYSFASMSNVMSSWFQYEALKFVSFPLQVLSKSSKILFTMLMGKVVSGRSFPTSDYINAAMIGVGLTIYRVSEPSDTEKGKPEGYFWVGIALLMGYIIADSFTSTWQQDIFQKYKVSQTSMMMGINCYSAALSMGMLVLHQQLLTSWWFMMEHPTCLAHCIIMSSCSAMGQIFIYRTIQNFGAVVFATFMTSRQLFSIVLSVYSFDHPLQQGGVFGLALVFTALGIKVRQEFLAKKNGKSGNGAKGGKAGAGGGSGSSDDKKEAGKHDKIELPVKDSTPVTPSEQIMVKIENASDTNEALPSPAPSSSSASSSMIGSSMAPRHTVSSDAPSPSNR